MGAALNLQRSKAVACLKVLWSRIQEHQLLDAAASTAFWALLALFPFMFFAISSLASFFDQTSIEAVVSLVTVFAPDAVRSEVRSYVERVLASPRGAEPVLALLVSLWSATGGAVSIGDALNRAYGVSRDRRGFVKRRAEAALAVVVCALLLLVATIVSTFGPWAIERIFSVLGLDAGAAATWSVARFPVALLTSALAWAIGYRFLPDTQLPFRLLSPGALLGIPVWVLGSAGFSFYVEHFAHYSVAYGSIGTAIIILLWAYLSIFLLLVGGEVNAIQLSRRPPAAQPSR